MLRQHRTIDQKMNSTEDTRHWPACRHIQSVICLINELDPWVGIRFRLPAAGDLGVNGALWPGHSQSYSPSGTMLALCFTSPCAYCGCRRLSTSFVRSITLRPMHLPGCGGQRRPNVHEDQRIYHILSLPVHFQCHRPYPLPNGFVDRRLHHASYRCARGA